MAGRNYLVEGLSGSGKSSVYDELIRRGFPAISTDRAWKSGPGIWDERRALAELERAEPDVVFVCGSSRNRDRFLPLFAKVFNLRIDDETMRRRLAERTNNDYGKRPDELALMLELNRRGERPAGAIDLDATRPLAGVVDELLRLADCPPARVDTRPWARRAGSTAPAEFAWSGDVLDAVLAYLGEHGIDLRSDRLDPAAFDGAALRRAYEERTGTEADGVEYALLDGIAFLRDAPEAVSDTGGV